MDIVDIAIAKKLAGGGGGGSSLPSVTSADAGKVLAVNGSGEWAAGEQGIYFMSEDNEVTFSFNDIITLVKNGVTPKLYQEIEEDGYMFYSYTPFTRASLDDGYYVDFGLVFLDNNNDPISSGLKFIAATPTEVMQIFEP